MSGCSKNATSLAIFPDSERLLIFQEELRILKFLDGALIVDYQFPRRPDLVRDFRLVISPTSNAWSLGSSIYTGRTG